MRRSVFDLLLDHERDPSRLRAGWEEAFRNFAEAVRRHGSPQEAVPCVHVVGSKGKGSVATVLAALVEAAGRGGVGLYTSPHLVDVRERIRLSGRMIPRRDLERLARRVLRRTSGLSRFECLTLCAFLWYRERGAKFAVYEAGLGGRLDATNTVRPLGVLVTPIEREHEEVLGPGLARIAGEKLAVVKPGCFVLLARQRPEVLRMAERVCRRVGADLRVEGKDFGARLLGWCDRGMRFAWEDRVSGRRGVWETPMVSPVQLRNLAMALTALFRLFPDAEEGRVGRCLRRLVLPGRFEVLRRRPLRVFDVCHTPESFRSFVEAWRRFADPGQSTLVCCLLRDKAVGRILGMARREGFRRVLWLERAEPRAASVDGALVDGRISEEGFGELWREAGEAVALVGSFRLAPLVRRFSVR